MGENKPFSVKYRFVGCIRRKFSFCNYKILFFFMLNENLLKIKSSYYWVTDEILFLKTFSQYFSCI